MMTVDKYPDWIYRQSAVLPYRWEGEDIRVLLITSRKGLRWVPPKGIVEPGMSPQDSAAKEALEEAGLIGEVDEQSLGSYTYKKWGGTCRVEVFPMAVATELSEWPEQSTRRRAWLSLEAAAGRVDEKELRKLMRKLPRALAARQGERRPRDGAEHEPHRLIYLLRHAKSSWDDPALDDFDRPLAERGRKAGEAMRRYLELADARPELVLCSSSVRTRQTLKRVLPALGEEVSVRYERQIYDADDESLLNGLRGLPDTVESVMIVGHNPAVQILAIRLAGGGDPEALDRLKTKYPTGGLATFVMKGPHWKDLDAGDCELHSFVVPRDLV